jgi:hypothetical protein
MWIAGKGLFPCSPMVADGGGAGSGTVACDDGTGATDCCADPSATGACASEGLTCWTRCNFAAADAGDGYRSQKFCGGGQWQSGHGIFPCSRAASDAGSDASTACTFGADETCNDDPTINAFWGSCQPNGTCLCKTGRSINPATGRCGLGP